MFLKIFFGGLCGDFSDIKSSIHNRMDDFEFFFIAIFLLSENAATSGGRLANF